MLATLKLMILIGVIALAIVGCGDEPSAGDVDIIVSEASVAEIVEETVDGDPDPKVECTGRTLCEVTYTISEPTGPNPNQELFEEQRVVWAALYSDPQFESGVILLHVPADDASGRESTEELLRVRCDGDVAGQINWEAADAAARVRDLCVWF
jgi:hypothetical protein